MNIDLIKLKAVAVLAVLQREPVGLRDVQKQLKVRGFVCKRDSLITYLSRMYHKRLVKRASGDDGRTIYSLSKKGERQLKKHRKSIA